jgi:hypothetical protein
MLAVVFKVRVQNAIAIVSGEVEGFMAGLL